VDPPISNSACWHSHRLPANEVEGSHLVSSPFTTLIGAIKLTVSFRAPGEVTGKSGNGSELYMDAIRSEMAMA
jgi:hypothetical protein